MERPSTLRGVATNALRHHMQPEFDVQVANGTAVFKADTDRA